MTNKSITITTAAISGLLVLVASASAAPINYGDFNGNTIKYTSVTENSGTDTPPCSVPPTVSADTLDFNPTSFNSNSSGAGGVDITDGTLTFGIVALDNNIIDEVQFDEAGDFTLAGLGGAGTYASVTANFIIEITQVDGVNINPVQILADMVFTPSNGNWDLLNDGPGPAVNGGWSGSLDVDITQALIDASVSYVNGATQVSVILDNTLTTLSESGTQAFIAKKDTGGVTITVVPEPASLALLGLGTALIAVRRR